MTDPCNGLAGLLFGHKYQPRYSTSEPRLGPLTGNGVDGDFFLRAMETSKSKTYVHDVCVRCGAIAEGAK